MNSSSLYKVTFGKDKVNGSLFTGLTSTGEKIYGAAIHGSYNTTNVDLNFGGSAFKVDAKQVKYDYDQAGVYVFGAGDLKYPVYEGTYGKLNTSVGVKTEMIFSSAQSTSPEDPTKDISSSGVGMNIGFNSRTTYELPLTGKNSLGLTAVIDGRFDKSNVADEGSKSAQYESTTFISKYEYRHTPDIKATVEMAATLNKYGNNYSARATLENQSNKLSVMTNIGGRAPSFFPGQQSTLGVAYERISDKNG